jgi:Tfp pilus assembly protein PilN
MKAVNLLPPDLRGASKQPQTERSVVPDDSSGTGAYAVLGALALAVLAVAGVVLTGNAVKDREAELAQVSARQAQVASRAAALKPYADFDQLASERVATVTDLAGSRFDWEQTLRDLSRAIPSEVTLSQLTGNVSTDAGGGGSSLRGAIAAPAITLEGCTTDQPAVARLMARLRNVDGVTRVSLAKSEKADIDPSAAGAGAGAVIPDGPSTAADRMAMPCGMGDKPKFEMVMFFERDAAAATAPSATPPAPGTPGAPGQPVAATPTATPAAGAASTTTSTGTTSGGVSP